MELRQLSYFVKAAEMAHFTAAAAALYITQSTLSQQVKQLEEELGMLLFDRVGKQVRLTEAGRVFLDHARQVLLEVDKSKQAIQDLQQLLTGDLRIGVTYAFTSLLLPVLAAFTAKYPGIHINIDYGSPEELERKLRAAELDFVLAFHTTSEEKDLVMQPLVTSRIVMVVSKRHPLAQRKVVSLKELESTEMILATRGFSSRDFLDEIFHKHKMALSVKIELNDVHSLLSLIEKGHWATLLNERALTGWRNIVAIPVEGREWLRRSYILWQKGTYRKKAAALFVKELLRQVAAE
ncbi:LysR substrate-binding domain-containing protein [Chitinophaga vietnamensis]|uniref:LysR substrate-binding domain-containing protein n=1 Tax=Chitinophaga vietnamensis TaxID=2593957 RepID=UPI0011787017|nr:LysR substrate-binding domain-containing protein [Chitinophaga vietnamensis]